jgi:hypothetical protein
MKSSTWGSRVRPEDTTITPTPPRPDMKGSTTLRAAATATAASTALPPASSISIPAIDARGWAEVTIPRRPITAGR